MSAKKQVHIRLDKDAAGAVEALRRRVYPTPSVAEVMRDAVVEKAERETKFKAAQNNRRSKAHAEGRREAE